MSAEWTAIDIGRCKRDELVGMGTSWSVVVRGSGRMLTTLGAGRSPEGDGDEGRGEGVVDGALLVDPELTSDAEWLGRIS